VGGCQADAENSCIQTLAISQQGKIEAHSKKSIQTREMRRRGKKKKGSLQKKG
jgi:hypothetical protein